ncbi:MAG: ATP-binding protein [Sphingobacteriales bacterium]|jgi:hypothetical protein|nr:ATP-binding protein [Sphingobacteriales bacterium]
MKYLFSFILLCVTFSISGQQHRLVKIWETDTTFSVPESVLLHKGKLFVSLIDGTSWDDDGKGGIGILSTDGKKYNGNWITGLSAPKGMAIIGKRMYVADITRVVVIDLKEEKVINTIHIPTSENLNDITVGKDVVYVSDSKSGKIWIIVNDKPEIFLNTTPRVNGVKFYNNQLFYGEGKSFKKIDAGRKITTIAQVTENIDGIEPLANGDFILTSWIGYIYYVTKGGGVQTLLETHQNKINTADIGMDAKNSIIYVPTFFGKKVIAYKIEVVGN